MKNVQISGSLKNFKPDCGIRDSEAAIEFKFVRDEKEAAVIFSGIAEDSAGYKGSKNWTRFYVVIYQAKPFILKSHLKSDLQRIKAADWTPIVVNGAISRKRKPAK